MKLKTMGVGKMPKGVYVRKPSKVRDESNKKNLEKGRTPDVRAKVREKLIENAQDEAWREKVSKATKEAMHRPEVRGKHLKGLEMARKKHGVNFRGGNGQEMTDIIGYLDSLLREQGFIREYPVKTKSVIASFPSAATVYKVDFADPIAMVAIEVDSGLHNSKESKITDAKKTKVLEALGWTVLRLKH